MNIELGYFLNWTDKTKTGVKYSRESGLRFDVLAKYFRSSLTRLVNSGSVSTTINHWNESLPILFSY